MLSKNIVDIKNMQNNIIKSLYLDEVIWEKQGGIKWYGVDELLAMGAEEKVIAETTRNSSLNQGFNPYNPNFHKWSMFFYGITTPNPAVSVTKDKK